MEENQQQNTQTQKDDLKRIFTKSKIFYFDTKYEIRIQERRNFHIAGKYKYTYDKICTFFDKNKKVFQINYSFVDDTKSYKKEFFDSCVLAFETFRITRK